MIGFPFTIQKISVYYNIMCNGHDTVALTTLSVTGSATLALEIESAAISSVSLLLELDSASCDIAMSLAELL